MLAADTFMQFSAIHDISSAAMPRSDNLHSKSIDFNNSRILSAQSAADSPPKIFAIFANFSSFAL